MPSRLPALPVVLFLLVLPAASLADRAQHIASFQQLNPAELRSAEQNMSSLVDRRTGQALREPVNDAEAYVIARQQRLVKRLASRPQVESVDDGGVARHFWPAARATRITIGPDGQPQAQCISAPAMLEPALPDFRLSNHSSRPDR